MDETQHPSSDPRSKNERHPERREGSASAFDPALNLVPERLPQRTAAYALMAFCALIVAHPLVVKGASCGHDFDFHLQSWLATSANWYPHWLAGANYGAGEPRFLFYPPASWLLGAVLGHALPWIYVPAAFTWLALFASGCAARHMARHWMAPTAATVAGCLYLANPYLLFTGFERTAYGELLAAMWLPLLVLYALRTVVHWRARVVPLALAVAALWLTNAPAAVMGCYLAMFCGFFATAAGRSVAALGRRFALILAAIALGTSLAAFYVLPAWYEQRWVQIARATGSGMRIEDSFLFGHTGEPFHDQVLATASWLAVAILASAAVGSALTYRRAPSPLQRALAAICAVILLLLFPVSAPLWNHLPQLRFLQFPWRWLLVAGLAASTLLALNVRPVWRMRPIALCLIAWSFGASIWAATQFWQRCDEEDNIQAQLQIQESGFEGTDEYTAGAADNSEIQQGLPPIRLLRAADMDEGDDSANPNPPWRGESAATVAGSFAIERWAPEHKSLTIVSAEPAYAVLRLDAYPAWRVRLNGLPCGAGCAVPREDGLLTITVPRGGSHIEADFSPTPDREIGDGISLLAALALAATARRRKPSAPAASYD